MADYQMGGGYIEGETEQEYQARRRREAEQAAAMAGDNIDAGGGQNFMDGSGQTSMGNMLGRAFDNRIQAAGNRVTSAINQFENPQQALEQRLGVTQPVVPDAANTEVQSQQVKTYADGSQEHVVKTSTPAVMPMPETAPVSQAMPAPAPSTINPQAQAAAIQRMQAAAAATQPPAQPAPAGPAVPQDLVAGGGVPAVPAIGTPPTPGAPMQTAGPVNPAAAPAPVVQQAPAGAPGASLAQAGQTAQAPETRPQWAIDLEAAGTDQNRLIDIAGNKAYPLDVREDAKAKLRTAMVAKDAETQAQQTVLSAAQGDPKAQQKLLNSIKPGAIKKDEEQVTEGSYIRAYLYARLGLNDLAQEEQQKILGKNKFGQVTVDGTSYEVETDRNGRVVKARDNEGTAVDAPILNKIRAEAAKFGTHAYSFTGEAVVIPPSDKQNAGQEYQSRKNAITGQIENVITTGPNAGKLYNGPPGLRVSVGTAAAKAEQGKQISLAYDPLIEAAKKGAGFLGEFNAKNGTNFAIVGTGAGGAPIIVDNNTNVVVKKNDQGVVTAVTNAGAGNVGLTGTGNIRGSTPAEIEQNMALNKTAAEANIQLKKDVAAAEQKVPAEAKGKNQAKDINNQRYSDETYGLIRPISDAIKQSTGSGLGTKVDQLAGVFGVGTTGAQAKASLDVLGYNLVSNVPRFEGAQSDRDVALYERAAGDIANTEKPINVRLAALSTIVGMLKKYDKAGANDWTFGTAKPNGEIKIISREKVQ